jgi:sugar phosphate isomerase/epimerase
MNNVPVISVGFDGYPLSETVEHLAKTGSTRICLCALDEFTHHVLPEQLGREEWDRIRNLLAEHGLSLRGLEGHTNVSDPSNGQKIRKRMEFTRFLGGQYFDTSAGPVGSEASFRENMKQNAQLAEELDLLFCLETHGDIVGTGREAAKVVGRIGSERVRLCYDPANVYFYSRGAVDPVKDVEWAIEHIGLIHFKGTSYDRERGEWSFPLMRDADFQYEDFFTILKKHRYRGLVAIEIEKMFHFSENAGFVREPTWTPEAILDAYRTEIDYLGRKLHWIE